MINLPVFLEWFAYLILWGLNTIVLVRMLAWVGAHLLGLGFNLVQKLFSRSAKPVRTTRDDVDLMEWDMPDWLWTFCGLVAILTTTLEVLLYRKFF